MRLITNSLSAVGVTSESKLLVLTAIAAALAYLISMEVSPLAWTYLDWLRTGLAALLWYIGKLQKSNLASTEELTWANLGGTRQDD